MKQTLQVLIVEDSADDAKLTLRELVSGGWKVTHTRVETADQMRAALEQQEWDLVLCDYALPHFSGEAALLVLKEAGRDVPFIFVSGTIGEEAAVASMKAGAHDYVMKGNLARLVPAIQRELRDAAERRQHLEAERQMRMSEHKYRHLFRSMSDAALLVAEETDRIIDANEQAEFLFGRSRDEFLGLDSTQLYPPPAGGEVQGPPIESAWHVPGGCESVVQRKNGTTVPVHVSITRIQLYERPFLLTLFRDISERKQSESALKNVLRQAQTMFMRFAIDAPTDWEKHGVEWAAANFQWKTLPFDEAAAQAVLPLDVRPGEGYDAGWVRAKHPDDEKPMGLIAHQAFLSGAPSWHQEFRCTDRHGQLHWFAQVASIEPAGYGHWQVMTVNTDITERKLAENALHAREEEFRALAENAPDAICRFDCECRLTYTNPAYNQLLALPVSQLLGRTPKEIYPDQPGIDEYQLKIQQVASSGTPFEYETALGALSGEYRPFYNVRLVPERDRAGRVVSVLCMGRDISELKETERQLRTLVENSPDIILRFDRAGRYLFVNHAMEKVTGIPAAEYLGRVIGEIATAHRGPDVAAKFQQLGLSVKRVFVTGEGIEEEMRLPFPGGEQIFNVRLIPEADERGQVASVLTLAREVTARQRAEEALRASMDRVLQQESTLIALTRQAPLQSGDLASALRRLTESSARALGVARVSLWRYQPDRQVIRCVDLFEYPSGRHSDGTELAAADYPAYFKALAESEVIAADDARTEPRTAEFTKVYLEPLGITSMMDVPIHLKGALDGVLCHEHIGPPRTWTSDERTFALAIANLTTLVLEEWERKQAQEELRESQQAYASLVNTVDGIVWELDVATFRFTFVSQQAERLLGYPAQQWIDDPNFWKDHVHEGDRSWAIDFCVSATREKRDHDFKYRMIAADGRIVWLHDLVTIVIENDSPVKLRGIMVDITESKRAEEALHSSEQRFRQVTENIDEVFWLTDPSKNEMIYISPAYQRMWGRTCESLYARPQSWLDAVHPDDRARVRSAAVTLQSAGGYNLEYRIARPDGVVRWIHDRAFPIHDAEGNVYRIAGVAADITEKRQLEDQLRQAQKMDSLGTLAGGIAHDFNNILTGVLGSADVARLELPPDHPVIPWIRNITVAGNRARELVQQILTFGRKHESEMAPRKLQLVVDEALHLLRSTIPSMVQIDSRIDPSCAPVVADDTQIHQVVMNLCTNAWHALPKHGGRIEVSLAPVQITAEMAATRLGLATGPYVLLSVQDNGRGMTPDVVARIFEPFFTTKKPGHGTGLGLAVVHGIVQSHQGAIFAQSTPGNGTLFEVFLPAVSHPSTGLQTATEEPLPRGHGERIMLVDDDASALSGLRGQLEHLGYRVTALSDPRTAVELFLARPESFDLILTDYAMPDFSGHELAAKVLAGRPGIPVILASGFIDSKQIQRARTLGVREFMRKPISSLDLARSLERHLRKE